MTQCFIKYGKYEFPVDDKAAVANAVAAIQAACPKATAIMQKDGEVAVVAAVGSKAQKSLEAALDTIFPMQQTQSQAARPYSVAAPAPAPVSAPAPTPIAPQPPAPAPATVPAAVAPQAPATAPAPKTSKALGVFARFVSKPQQDDEMVDTWAADDGDGWEEEPKKAAPKPVAAAPVVQQPAPATAPTPEAEPTKAVVPVVVPPKPSAGTPASAPAPAPVLSPTATPTPAPVAAKAPSKPKGKVVAETAVKAQTPVVKALKEAAKALDANPVTGIDHPQSGKLCRERIERSVSGSEDFHSEMTVKDIKNVAVDGTKFFDFATKASLLETLNELVANQDTARFVALANIVHKDSGKKGKKSDGDEANKAEEAIVGVHFHYPGQTNVGSKPEGSPELAEVQEWVVGGFGRLTESKYGTKEAAILIAFDQLFDRWNDLVKFSENNTSKLPSRIIVGTNFARAAAILTGRKLLKMDECRELYWYANHICDKFKAINVEVSIVYTSDDGKGDCDEDLYGEVIATHGKNHFSGRVEKRNYKADDPLSLVELLSWHGANFARCLGKHLPDLLANTKTERFVIRQ